MEQGRYLRNRSNKAIAGVIRAWRANATDDFDRSYADASLPMLAELDDAQNDIAAYMVETTPDVMQSVGSRRLRSAEYPVDPTLMVGTAGNGQDTFSNLWSSILEGKHRIGEGHDAATTLAVIERDIALRSRTLLADTARTASMMAARSHAYTATYIRALTPPSCGRCIILAGIPSGRTPFPRHPHCDCTAVWSTDEAALATHYAYPTDYLNSLDDKELSKALHGEANASAWKDGADINQLVNAYRSKGGVRTAQIYGRNIAYSTEGVTKHGLAYRRMKQAGYVKAHVRQGSKYWKADRPRLMPETIYQVAGDNRTEALRLLHNYGWIL